MASQQPTNIMNKTPSTAAQKPKLTTTQQSTLRPDANAAASATARLTASRTEASRPTGAAPTLPTGGAATRPTGTATARPTAAGPSPAFGGAPSSMAPPPPPGTSSRIPAAAPNHPWSRSKRPRVTCSNCFTLAQGPASAHVFADWHCYERWTTASSHHRRVVANHLVRGSHFHFPCWRCASDQVHVDVKHHQHHVYDAERSDNDHDFAARERRQAGRDGHDFH